MKFGTLDDRFVLVRDGRALDVAIASDDVLPADPVAVLARWDDLLAWEPTADWSGGSPSPTPNSARRCPTRARCSRSR
jgi:hypothetical protein